MPPRSSTKIVISIDHLVPCFSSNGPSFSPYLLVKNAIKKNLEPEDVQISESVSFSDTLGEEEKLQDSVIISESVSDMNAHPAFSFSCINLS